MITDRMRFSVIQANTDTILARDLVVKEPEVITNLSAPSSIRFKLDQGQELSSSYGIAWKNWGQWVVCEMEFDYERTVWAYGIVTDNKVDSKSGELSIEVTGPIGYPKGIQWLENFNPIAVDPFEVVQRIWAHVQGFSNANLGVEITPASSGTQMLPGFGFDGSILSFDFFAMFIRAVDFVDCGDTITGLARDIPFDMFEEAWWNAERTELWRQIRLAYPMGGSRQESLAFRIGNNVIAAERADEGEIEPVSDVIIRGWLPGKVYSSQLYNREMDRFRRTVLEENAHIDSSERAAAWAKRKLTRRQAPKYFSKILIDPNHPDAPLGTFNVGDSIRVQAPAFPWYGTIDAWHRVISIKYSEAAAGQSGGGNNEPQGMVELGLKVEDAFDYDPIMYDPDYESQPTEDPNRLANGYFDQNLTGWISIRGQWIRVATMTYDDTFNPNAGCVRCDLDDEGEAYRSHRAWCEPGETLTLCCAVRWQDVEWIEGSAIQLLAFTSYNGEDIDSFVVDEYVEPEGVHGWELFMMTDWVVPTGVNEVALQFNVSGAISHGISWWTYARVLPTV